MTILDDIVAYKKDEVALAKSNTPLTALEEIAQSIGPARGFAARLAKRASTGYALIAEVKKASPSKGLIRADFNPAAIARAYEDGGAACLSVLTDGPSFQGAPAFLKEARVSSRLPLLRKDFMIDPYQVVEARAWGADCILLIMACLEDGQAADLAAAAKDYGLDILVETHDEAEMARALKIDATLIGVNNRNLKTFHTDLGVTARLATMVPADRLLVAESGISTTQDLKTLREAGAKAFLVGETLMRADDVAAATRTLLNNSPQTTDFDPSSTPTMA